MPIAAGDLAEIELGWSGSSGQPSVDRRDHLGCRDDIIEPDALITTCVRMSV
jgi:hypothetical protein